MKSRQIYLVLAIAAVLSISLLAPVSAYAEDELPEVGTFAAGLGQHYGGLGVNYMSIGEDSNIGFILGGGFSTGLSFTGGGVYRFSEKNALFLTYGGAGVYYDYGDDYDEGKVIYGPSLMWGNAALEGFRYCVGLSFPQTSDTSVLFDFGLGYAF